MRRAKLPLCYLMLLLVLSCVAVATTPQGKVRVQAEQGGSLTRWSRYRLPTTTTTPATVIEPVPDTVAAPVAEVETENPPLPDVNAEMHYTEASFYTTREMGDSTASGIPLNDSSRTAAHRTLDFGTRLMVCADGCVSVVVTDRGPYVGGRDLDLSEAAFEAIAPTSAGHVKVSWQIVP